MTTLVFTIIFGKVAKISTDGLPPFLFSLSGVVGWRYFADCLSKTSNTFVANANIFGKVYFPRLCIPLSVVISNLIGFGIQFVMFLGFLVYYCLQGAPVNPQSVLCAVASAGTYVADGRPRSWMRRRRRLIAYHQVPRSHTPGHLWRAVVDVRYPHRLPCKHGTGKVAVGTQPQPHGSDHRSISVCVPWCGDGRFWQYCDQRGDDSGYSGDWDCVV